MNGGLPLPSNLTITEEEGVRRARSVNSQREGEREMGNQLANCISTSFAKMINEHACFRLHQSIAKKD